MANELITQDDPPPEDERRDLTPLFGSRQLSERAMAGAVEIESNRAVAEAQAAMAVAQKFRRDELLAARRMDNACKRQSFAEDAFYKYKRGGKDVEGPSIRMAEELIRCWGNMDYGLRELSQAEGYSEMEAFAHDLETNVRSKQQFTVKHIRDTQGGGKALTDQRDIYEIGANMGARRMRARILAILPSWYVEDAIRECKKTLAGQNGGPSIGDRIKRALAVLDTIGVTEKMIIERFGHPLDAITPDELVTLQGIHKAIKDGQTTVAEEFGGGAGGAVSDTSKRLAAAAAKPAAAKPASAPKADAPKEAAKEEPKSEPKAEPKAEAKAEDPQAAQEPPQQASAATEPEQASEAAGDALAGAAAPAGEEDVF